MAHLISEVTRKARKSHYCMASVFVTEDPRDYEDFTKDEKRVVDRARENDFIIIIGDDYFTQFIRYGNSVYTFKAIPEMHEICIKYDLYPDD